MALPHLKGVNPVEDCEKDKKINGIVIRSANDDNVHKVIAYLSRPSSTAFGPPPPKTKARSNNSGNENSHTASTPTSFSVQSKAGCSKEWPA